MRLAALMPFDFESIRHRHGTDSQKWQKYRDRDVLAMWVADMDFHCAPTIVEALKVRADDGVFGYCRPVDSTIEAVLAYLEKNLGWKVDAEWLVWLPGLVPGINLSCRGVGERGDAVLVPTPVYPPFLVAPRMAERDLISVPLIRNHDGWEIDWDAMERAVTPRTRLVLLCSPHNPVGRVWRKAELEQLAAFCARHNLVICSDEIHCDLILDEVPHVATATLGPEIAARTITLLAPSKTYNIAGLACSYAVIPDPALRRSFRRAGIGVLGEVNNFGYAACEAAYRTAEPWRQELLVRLRANRDLLEQTVNSDALPGVAMTHIEATYLAWLNVEALKLNDPVGFFESGGVGLSGGAAFGDARYVRLNFGCPEALLREGLTRMQRAIAMHRRPT